MPKKANKNSGFCVYFLAHGGVGRQIQETDDMVKTKKELIAGQPYNEIYDIACGADRKTAIKKYNDLVQKSRTKKRLKREAKKKTLKKRSSKRKHLKRNINLA